MSRPHRATTGGQWERARPEIRPAAPPLTREGLPDPSRRGRLDDAVVQLLEEPGAGLPEPAQDIGGQLAIMRPGLSDFAGAQRLQPVRKLEGQQPPEERAHAHAGEKVARAPNSAFGLLVVSRIWTVQGQIHEAGERNDPLRF